MKLKKNILTIMIGVLYLAFIMSCSKNDDNGTTIKSDVTKFEPDATFIIENKKETMPVWMYGNNDSEYIILAVHDGPGSNVLDFRDFKRGTGFKAVEKNYLSAYWQQRAAGQSVGSDDKNLFSTAQYVDAADKVIDELKNRYPDKEIVLFGHSWDGMLTSSYLADTNRRAKMKAWVDAAGLHDGTNFQEATIADLNTEADKRITDGENLEVWEEWKQQLEENPALANRIAYAVIEEIPEVTVKIDITDFTFTERAAAANPVTFAEIVKTDNSPALKDFDLAVLLLWGGYDFAVSKTLRDEVIANLPTTPGSTSVLFPKSGHYMMFHEPELFANSLKEFIEGLWEFGGFQIRAYPIV